jgi:anti-anti-sigma factor
VTTLLDLSAVSFIDSAGLRVLLRSARAVDAHHWVVVLHRPGIRRSAAARRGERHQIAPAAGGAA